MEPTQKHEEEHHLSDRLFEDPTVAQTLAEDPLLKFLKTNGNYIFWSVVAVVFAFVAFQRFNQATEAAIARGSESFSRVRAGYLEFQGLKEQLATAQAELAKADATKKAELEKKAQEAQSKVDQSKKSLDEAVLALADSRKPFDQVAKLYRALIAQSAGDFAGAKGILSGFNWQQVKDLSSSDRFYAELAGVALARLYLDDESSVAQGNGLLKALAEQGSYAHVQAAMSLAQVATTEAEIKDAIFAIENLIARAPEQQSLLDADLKRLKNLLPAG